MSDVKKGSFGYSRTVALSYEQAVEKVGNIVPARSGYPQPISC